MSQFPELWPAGYRIRARALGPGNPLLRSVAAHPSEVLPDPEGRADPCSETLLSPVPYLVRKHRDRALVLVSSRCFIHCRFCFRRGQTGRLPPAPNAAAWAGILSWLQEHPEVNELILSGGDPLTLSDLELKRIADHLAGSPHLRRWRIHTRAPVVEPGRVTADLVHALDNGLPLRVVLHANHPAELVPGARGALRTLRAGGVALANQAVLLRGVNDHPRILLELVRQLTEEGVEPYYLHHPDRATGNRRFRVSIRQGRQLYRALVHAAEANGQYLRVPPYVLDLPNGCGKSPVENLRPTCAERSGGGIRIRYRWQRPAGWDSSVAVDTYEWWDIWETEGSCTP